MKKYQGFGRDKYGQYWLITSFNTPISCQFQATRYANGFEQWIDFVWYREFEQLAQHYLTCALFTADDENIYTDFDAWDFDLEIWDQAEIEIFRFIDLSGIDNICNAIEYYDFDKFSYNIWYTRNGHGGGFWEEDDKIWAAALDKAAEQLGPVDCYIGDNGKLYIH